MIPVILMCTSHDKSLSHRLGPTPCNIREVLESADWQACLQAPRDAVLKTFGAVAAAQLVLSGVAPLHLQPRYPVVCQQEDTTSVRITTLYNSWQGI